MTLKNVVHALLARWGISVGGVLLTLAVAGMAYAAVPPQYTSTGNAVLVRPKQIGTNTANPLLSFDASLSTTALILIKSLNAPTTPDELGLMPGREKFTVQSATSSYAGDQIVQPFINVTAQSPSAARATAIVFAVLDRAQVDLRDTQKNLRVAQSEYIKFQTVVSSTPPKPVLTTALALPGAVVIVGLMVTIGCALLAQHLGRKSAPRPDSRDVSPANEPFEEIRVPSSRLVRNGAKNDSPVVANDPERG